jgi:hypothetical protein
VEVTTGEGRGGREDMEEEEEEEVGRDQEVQEEAEGARPATRYGKRGCERFIHWHSVCQACCEQARLV